MSIDNITLILSNTVDTAWNLTLFFFFTAIYVIGECIYDGGSCHTYLGVQVPEDAGIAGIACLQSLHMFPLFAPEPGGPSAAAVCSPRPENIRIM